jgi:flagellar hook-length control protein FliK
LPTSADGGASLGATAAQQSQTAGQSRVSAALTPADPTADALDADSTQAAAHNDRQLTGQPGNDPPTNALLTPTLKRSAAESNDASAATLRAALRAVATQRPANEDVPAAPSVATMKGAGSSAAASRPAPDADSRAAALNALRATLAGTERPNVTDPTATAEGKDGQATQAGDGSPSRQGGTGAGQQNAQNNHSFDLAAAITPALPLGASADLQAHLAKMLDAAQAQVVASTERGAPAPPVNATSIAAALANVPDADLSRQIVQGVRLQWHDGVGEAKITLQPDYLGSVSVSLRVSDGGVTATLHADSPAVRSWIETNEPSLRQALADQGLTLHRLTIVDEPAQASNQNGRDPGAQQGQQQQQQQPQRQQRRRQGDGETFESLM